MVVGQEQELDVKIVKVQNADIICLGYEVTAGREYMHVDEFGKVTALKEGGKATVEVALNAKDFGATASFRFPSSSASLNLMMNRSL